jgi:arsenate reductase
MKKILYVCVENSNRSQMAQAFTNIHGHDIAESYSAGSKPSGRVNPIAIESMLEVDYDLTKHIRKEKHNEVISVKPIHSVLDFILVKDQDNNV